MDETETSVAAKLQVVLRPEQLEDCRAVAAAHIATWQAGYVGILPAELLASHDLDRRTQRRRERFAENDGDSTLIADLEGRIIGHVSFGPYRAKPEQGDLALGDPAPRDLAPDERAPEMPALGESALNEPVPGVPAPGDLVPVLSSPSAATSGNPVFGDAARGDAARGDAAWGDAARGDAARGDAAWGDAAPGVPAASDAARDNPEIGEPEIGEPQIGEPQIGEPRVDGALVGEIGALYVHPDYWGVGVGTRLLSAALEGLPQRVIRLWVLEHNHRARRFFAQQGFKPDGARSLFQPDGVGEGYPEIRYTLHRG